MRHAITTVVCAGIAAAGGCRRGDPAGPRELRLGRDECAECGMTIHEERSAAAIVVDRGGRPDHLVFDDLGCLLDFENARSEQVTARFVHDYATGAWIQAGGASYLVTDGSILRTPMASGMAAFAHPEVAAAGQRQYGGEVLDFEALVERRRQTEERRRSAPDG